MHVNYTLRKTENIQIVLNQLPIPQKDSEKYLGMHLYSRLNWKHYVRQKEIQIKEKMRKLYWLMVSRTTLRVNHRKQTSTVCSNYKTDLDLRHSTVGLCQ